MKLHKKEKKIRKQKCEKEKQEFKPVRYDLINRSG
jgi:hypothetical protein